MTDFYQPRNVALRDGLILLPQFGSPSGGTHRPLNAYALVFGERCVLFDAPLSHALPGVRRLIADGVQPVAVVLSHADLAESGDAFEAMEGELDLPIYLHPADQADARAKRLGIDWRDPTAADGPLAEMPVELIHWPGHSPGSTMLYTAEHGGILLAGDSAVAPGPMQPDGSPPLVRPPASGGVTDAEVVARWKAFDRQPLAMIAPLHGNAYVDVEPAPLLRSLWESEPMKQEVRRLVD